MNFYSDGELVEPPNNILKKQRLTNTSRDRLDLSLFSQTKLEKNNQWQQCSFTPNCDHRVACPISFGISNTYEVKNYDGSGHSKIHQLLSKQLTH